MRATTHSKPHRTLSQVVICSLIFLTPYVLWHSLCAICHTSTPIVVVTSGSMEPVYQRGDILFVSNRAASIELGDIAVCWLEGRRLPFVHRVVEKHVLDAGTRGNERYGRRNIYSPPSLLRQGWLADLDTLASKDQAVNCMGF